MSGIPKIIVLSEQMRGTTFELTEPRYTLGRSEECDVYIPDPTMSSHHSSLVRTEDENYILEDSGSTNGTRVNGVRIDSQELNNSDIIQVGAVELLYDCAEKSVTSLLSTQTNINLLDTSEDVGLEEMESLDPFGSHTGGGEKEGKTAKIAIYLTIAVLVIGALAFLGKLLMQIME